MSRQLVKQIAKDGIPMDIVSIADEMPGSIDTPGHLIGQERAMNQFGRYPAIIDEIGNGGDVPNDFGPANVDLMIPFDNIHQIIADRAPTANIGFQLGDFGKSILFPLYDYEVIYLFQPDRSLFGRSTQQGQTGPGFFRRLDVFEDHPAIFRHIGSH